MSTWGRGVHMKNFITNYWQKILLVIGGIFILINSFKKIFAEKVLLSDYIKYGKNIESNSSTIIDVAEKIDTSTMPFSAGVLKLIIVLMASILLIIFITSLADKAGAKDKKKWCYINAKVLSFILVLFIIFIEKYHILMMEL